MLTNTKYYVFKDRMKNVYITKNSFKNGKNTYCNTECLTSKHLNCNETIKINNLQDQYTLIDSKIIFIKCKIYQYFKYKNDLIDGIPNISDSIC